MDSLNLQPRAKDALTEIGVASANLENIKTPEQFLAQIKEPGLRNFVSLMLMGQGIGEGNDFPQWARCAAKELFDSIFGGLNPKMRKSENYRLGFLMGAARKWIPELNESGKQLASFYLDNDIPEMAHAALKNEPDNIAAEFYQGFSDGISQWNKITPGSTTAVYAVIAVTWSDMAALKNVGEVQSWLEKCLPKNLVGSRDRIAKICQKIHFPLSDKGGRPKSKPRKA